MAKWKDYNRVRNRILLKRFVVFAISKDYFVPEEQYID